MINVIVLVEIAYLFNCRSFNRSLLKVGLWTNPWAIGGAGALLLMQLLFTYAPFMNRLFQTSPLGIHTWLRIAAVALLAFVAVELEKWVRFRRGRGERAIPE